MSKPVAVKPVSNHVVASDKIDKVKLKEEEEEDQQQPGTGEDTGMDEADSERRRGRGGEVAGGAGAAGRAVAGEIGEGVGDVKPIVEPSEVVVKEETPMSNLQDGLPQCSHNHFIITSFTMPCCNRHYIHSSFYLLFALY